MKKLFAVLLSVCMMFSVAAFAGCDDNQALLDRIAKLEQQLEDAGSGDTQALLNRIKELEKQLENASGGDTVQEQIDALSGTVSALQGTIDALNTTIAALQAGNAELKDSNTQQSDLITELESKHAQLQASMQEAETRLQVLEATAVTNTEHVYRIGEEGNDTVTLYNNGIKLFSIQVTFYGSKTPPSVGIYVDTIVTNYALNTSLKLNEFLNIQAMDNKNEQKVFSTESYGEISVPLIGSSQYVLATLDSSSFTPAFEEDQITHILIGLSSKHNPNAMIPFAKFAVK